MYIDIGASSFNEVVVAGIRIGDPVVPQGDFAQLVNSNTFMSKALDNRLGCALLVDILRHFLVHGHPNQIYAVATVMEETGMRGATTSARVIDPDAAIILEADVACDVPGLEATETSKRLGGGPTVWMFDPRMSPNIRFRDLALSTAADLNIQVQLSAMLCGTSDGAAIRLHGTGVPTIVIGVPVRHIHTHGAILHGDDYIGALRLSTALVAQLDATTVDRLTEL
jgi:endoglucanase